MKLIVKCYPFNTIKHTSYFTNNKMATFLPINLIHQAADVSLIVIIM